MKEGELEKEKKHKLRMIEIYDVVDCQLSGI